MNAHTYTLVICKERRKEGKEEEREERRRIIFSKIFFNL